MKLASVLDRLNSIEKNSFIKVIDNIISKEPKNIMEINKILSSTDKGLKSIDSQNIAKIFDLTKEEFRLYIKCEFQEITSQLDILIDIITRDGNSIMSQDWFSRLYEKEINHLKKKIKGLESEINSEKSDLSMARKRDYKIYKTCLETAYFNDLSNNRDSKITSDELSIMLTLGNQLGLSQEEIKLINYSILPINKLEITNVIKELKNIGIIFYSNKENTIYVADEMVRILRKVRGKEVAEKFYRRTLNQLKPSIINMVCREHNIDWKLSHLEKIEGIIKEGVPFTNLLKEDIYKPNTNLTEKKRFINELCEKKLNINNVRGNILEEKIQSLIEHFEMVERDEKVGISIDGFSKMLMELQKSLPKLNGEMRSHFELQDEQVLRAEYLLDYNIKPRDILDLINKEDLEKFMKDNSVKLRGDNILNILEHYKDVENLYMENYENVAYRNLNILKENGILVKESELGLKFEELTRRIFIDIGLNVDDELRNKLNTRKDKIDILLNLGNNEIIIIECKTRKEKGYNKFSTVSRQLKSYQNTAIRNDLRIVKILLVAPEFSDDFVTDCEMDTEMNLSLVSASTLLNISESFKESKYKEFPHVLFRDVVLNEERILKALSK